MIANFFNASKPINFLFLGVLSLIVFIMAVVFNFSGNFSWHMLPRLVFNFFLFLLFLFFHNFIVRKNNLTLNNTYALLFFILMFALFPTALADKNLLISNFILFFAFRRIYSMRSGLAMKSKLFDSAMWIGLASLVYPWSVIYIALVYVALFVYRKFMWNYFLIPVLGYITPIYLYWVYLFVQNRSAEWNQIWNLQTNFVYRPYNQFSILIPISLVLVFILWTVYPTLSNAMRAKKKVKNSFRLILIHLFLAIILTLLSPLKNGSEFIFLFFPFSVLMANYLQIVKEYWFKESLIVLFVVLTGVVLMFS